MQIYDHITYKAVVEQAQDRFQFIIGNFTEVQAKQWIDALMKITHTFHALENRTDFVEVVNGKAIWPEDAVILISIAKSCETDLKQAECNPCNVTKMKWDTADLSCKYHYIPIDYYNSSGVKYTVNHGTIFTQFDTGIVRVIYKALPKDENGDPSIPAEGSWMEAAIHDLAWKVASNLYFMDKFDERKLDRIERDRDWYVAQAVNKANIFNRPQREVFKDDFIKTIKDLYPEDSNMSSLSNRELRKWHGSYNPGVEYNNTRGV
jgi:hypothetical protein